jgi:hypothetical protein
MEFIPVSVNDPHHGFNTGDGDITEPEVPVPFFIKCPRVRFND